MIVHVRWFSKRHQRTKELLKKPSRAGTVACEEQPRTQRTPSVRVDQFADSRLLEVVKIKTPINGRFEEFMLQKARQ